MIQASYEKNWDGDRIVKYNESSNTYLTVQNDVGFNSLSRMIQVKNYLLNFEGEKFVQKLSNLMGTMKK